MFKRARLSVIATTVATASCIGMGGVASASSIYTTGPGSYNAIYSNKNSRTEIENNNNVRLTNTNHQTAFTGNANVSGNTNRPKKPHKTYYPTYPTRNYTAVSYPSNDCDYRPKTSYSGYGNTYGGSATTGDATNYNSTRENVSVYNSAPTHYSAPTSYTNSYGGNDSIRNTGPGSRNTISSRANNSFEQTNNNNVTVSNSNYQTAASGNANVSGNTRGGNATTGDASNYNSTELSVNIRNQ